MLLITGFDPFGGESINPAWEAVQSLPEEIGPWRLHKMQLPTVFGKAARMVIEEAEKLHPGAILAIGQAGGRKGITPEQIAINWRCANIPDNEGNAPVDLPVIAHGPAAYFASLPVRSLMEAIKAEGIPASVSYSAGAFVCNDLFYSLLHHFRDQKLPIDFIHVPYLPQQAGENIPCLPLSDIVRGLTAAIHALPSNKEEK